METTFKKRTSRATVKVVERPETLRKNLMLGGILQGLGVTMRHFFQNMAREKPEVTINYPEEKIPYPARNRGLHRLMLRDDGEVRCVACMCCPTACPAHCITIVAEETGNGNEKRPAIFEIDELRCICCGLCVEACPCDAIRMDTGEHAHVTGKRHEAILGKNDLMSRGIQSMAIQGGVPSWREALRAQQTAQREVQEAQAERAARRREAEAAQHAGHGHGHGHGHGASQGGHGGGHDAHDHHSHGH